ncbi:SDR family oxidoreductase [Halorarius litoreus]|uniref:SDR family oxidoreductase n=1 Tax=Halorarius litoreus TaxID=2962676 RepID=UPI0020CFB222|nr:SDR family oxidoreductase [Halorarius litoreus]
MLTDKVCIVAGGGNGIGRATALELGNAGATVVVNDLGVSLTGEAETEQPAQQVVDAIEDAGGAAMAHYGDISSLEYTEALVADAFDAYGRVDGAVNFAGILQDSICYKMTGEQFDAVINVHLRGHFALLRNLAAHWREQAGSDGLDSQRSFLAVSSTAATNGNVGQVNYAAAKGGILAMVRTAAKELHRTNVRVNALLPSAYTRMIASMPDEEFKQNYQENKPPEKIAPLVGYMMSDEATDITGCSLRASGDMVGLMNDPHTVRAAVNDDGWTIESLAKSFRETVGDGEELTRV